MARPSGHQTARVLGPNATTSARALQASLTFRSDRLCHQISPKQFFAAARDPRCLDVCYDHTVFVHYNRFNAVVRHRGECPIHVLWAKKIVSLQSHVQRYQLRH
jgi:hypothetical protein